MEELKRKLINELDTYLFGWEYMDIERASLHGDAKLGGFILGACFIDAMAGFYAGMTKEESKTGSGVRFKNFAIKYLPHYDAEKLYEDLRCGLVHSYAEGGTYVFTDKNKAGSHFDKTTEGKIRLNLEDFLGDLKKAYKDFVGDIESDDQIFQKALKRYMSMGIMGIVPTEEEIIRI